MRTTRESLELLEQHRQESGAAIELGWQIYDDILGDLKDYHNIVDAIGKINPINKPGFEVLDRINTIIKDNGDKR